jgi:hypothetical protein
MRHRTRIVACGTILLITFIIYSWKAIGKPKTLPTGAEIFFGETQETKGTSIDSSSEFYDGQGSDVVQEFLQRPILTYAASVKLNSKTCPTEGVNFDEGAVKEQEEKWNRITPSKISRWRKDIAEHLYRKRNETQGEKKSDATDGEGMELTKGRGIVMAAGDSSSVNRARTNIRFLRSYNCTLPVEIFHFRNEMSESDKKLLEELSLPTENSDKKEEVQSGMKVTVREVEGVRKEDLWKEFQIKGAAIQQSSFDEILYLDTDSYLLRSNGMKRASCSGPTTRNHIPRTRCGVSLGNLAVTNTKVNPVRSSSRAPFIKTCYGFSSILPSITEPITGSWAVTEIRSEPLPLY